MMRYKQRLTTDMIMKALATCVAGFVLVLLGWILCTVIYKGAIVISYATITEPMDAPQRGLANAAVGSMLQLLMASILAIPIGILAGTYLSEANDQPSVPIFVRFINDVLLSTPSIITGLFIYQLLVVPMSSFSAIGGSVALAIVMLPIIVRTTEDIIRLVPSALREAAFALGASHNKVVRSIMWPAARAGICTGILLAIARAAGETAPLLFTSLGNPGWSFSLVEPMASLPVMIYQYVGSPVADLISLAWAGAFVITIGVLGLNLLSRILYTR